MERHKVILIGGDHYNGLSLVRLFGKNGLRPYGIIVGEGAEDGFLKTSGYWEKVWTLKSDDQIPMFLRRHFQKEKIRPVIIPWSDGAAAVLDRNLDTLSRSFIIGSIGKRQNAVNELMDKGRQLQFAHDCHLDTAYSVVLDLEKPVPGVDIPFPCIVKPLVSYQGEKKDIRKIENAKQLDDYIRELKRKGRRKILVQEYIRIDTEYDIEGFIHEGQHIYFVNQKVRTWPSIGGPTCYAFSVNDPILNREIDKIIAHLEEMEYTGLFDIEIFRVGSRFLFNEINWRNSAVCFAAVESGVDYPLYWYRAVTGDEFTIHSPERYGVFAMNELLDHRHVKCGDIGIRRWIVQLKSAEAKAYIDKTDMFPVLKRTAMFLTRRGRGLRNIIKKKRK